MRQSKRRKRGTTALSRQSLDPLWKMLDERIGGRKGLLSAAMASPSPKAPILAELILDKAFWRCGTKVLAQKAGMSMPEVVDLFRDKKQLEAILNLYETLPEVVKGATDDAQPQWIPCEECQGSKKAETGDDCWVCYGKGEVRRPGDKDKLAFVGEAVGLVGKKGPFVQTNIQVNNPGGQSESFESLMRRAVVKVERKQVEGVVENEVID